MKKTHREILMTLGLLIIIIILMNPYGIYMNFMHISLLVTLLIIFFIIISLFILKENPADEREVVNLYYSSRVSYFSGSAILLIGIIFQSFKHNIDIWLVIALAFMIMGKIVAQMYSERNR